MTLSETMGGGPILEYKQSPNLKQREKGGRKKKIISVSQDKVTLEKWDINSTIEQN